MSDPRARGQRPPSHQSLTGRVVTPTGVIDDGVVVVEAGRIAWVGHRDRVPHRWCADGDRPPASRAGTTLLPGLVDSHCHGGGGGEFGPDEEASRQAAAHHHRRGSTTLVASLVSAPPALLLAGVATCAALVGEGELAGVHLEGPFLSTARCGAQDPAALTDPDAALVHALVEAAAGAGVADAIVQMTYAPERAGAPDLARLLAGLGIVPAVGHTDADSDVTREALRVGREVSPRGGRPVVTHVFNAMPPLHHRDPGPVAACLERAAAGDAVLEVVGDGVHLAPGTVRLLFETVGADNLHLVTDAMAACGMPDGDYTLGGQDVVVTDGTARLARGGAIAGGVSTLLEVVRRCVSDSGVSLTDAVAAASATPARTLGLVDVGSLTAGSHADVLVTDDDLGLLAVMRRGSWVSPDDDVTT